MTRYPVVLPEYRQRESPVNPYVFVESYRTTWKPTMSSSWPMVGVRAALQAMRLRKGQQVIVNSGTAGMGYDLPTASVPPVP